jgi:hypothetical protein
MQSIHRSDPHELWLADPAGHPQVDQTYTPVDHSSTREVPTPETSRIALHHYVTKSKEEYQQKVARKSPDGRGKDWGFWSAVEGTSSVKCTDAVGLAEACRLPEIVRKQQELAAKGLWKL